MRKAMIALTCMALVVGATAAMASDTGVALGHKAPMAKAAMKNVDGKTTSIEQAAGRKGTLVIFTCNACPWVKAWESRMVEVANAYVKKDVGVIMINPNDPSKNKEDGYDEMVARAKKLGMQFPYAVDETSDIARAFGATRTPEAFLFDAKGALVYHGTIDDNAQKPAEVTERYLADALEAVATGGEVKMAETKALGCSIKFRAAAASDKGEAKKDAKSST
jgi:peroxiredoxin